jgi:large subunit ribosomal protein L23
MKNPYKIIKHRYVTEKANMLATLHTADSNPSLRRCDSPKQVFIVDPSANKQEIAWAIEQIYAADHVKVLSVNTINVKPKKRRMRRHLGKTSGFKKAIVTLSPGDELRNDK